LQKKTGGKGKGKAAKRDQPYPADPKQRARAEYDKKIAGTKGDDER